MPYIHIFRSSKSEAGVGAVWETAICIHHAFVGAQKQVKVESNSNKGKEAMLEGIESHVLPAFLGGEYTGEWRMLPEVAGAGAGAGLDEEG